MGLFDAYIFVDWSAASKKGPAKPTKDSVWVGELVPSNGHKAETYHRTRKSGIDQVTSVLMNFFKNNWRALVGFDFPYGYPAGFASSLALPKGSQDWFAVWAELAGRVKDSDDNVNNRFEAASEMNFIIGNGQPGPFWGCPQSITFQNLRPTSPGFPYETDGGTRLSQLRIVETRLSGVQETWKLFGAGSVGSQALVGIPYVYGLRRHQDLARVSRVWPFETGFTPTPAPTRGSFILHAEIWPGIVRNRAEELMRQDENMIQDQAQVRAMCEWAAENDGQGTLGQYFETPSDLSQTKIQACIKEQGWILGAM